MSKHYTICTEISTQYPRVLLQGLRQHLQLKNHYTTQVTAMHPCVQEDSRSAVVDCVHSGVEKKAVMVYIYVALLDLYNYWQSITSKSLRHLCTIKTLNCSRRCCNPLTYCSGTLFNCMDRVSAWGQDEHWNLKNQCSCMTYVHTYVCMHVDALMVWTPHSLPVCSELWSARHSVGLWARYYCLQQSEQKQYTEHTQRVHRRTTQLHTDICTLQLH